MLTNAGRVLRLEHAHVHVESVTIDGQFGDRTPVSIRDDANGAGNISTSRTKKAAASRAVVRVSILAAPRPVRKPPPPPPPPIPSAPPSERCSRTAPTSAAATIRWIIRSTDPIWAILKQ